MDLKALKRLKDADWTMSARLILMNEDAKTAKRDKETEPHFTGKEYTLEQAIKVHDDCRKLERHFREKKEKAKKLNSNRRNAIIWTVIPFLIVGISLAFILPAFTEARIIQIIDENIEEKMASDSEYSGLSLEEARHKFHGYLEVTKDVCIVLSVLSVFFVALTIWGIIDSFEVNPFDRFYEFRIRRYQHNCEKFANYAKELKKLYDI